MTKDQIKNAAMELEPAERELLAEELLLSIGDSERESIDRAWLEEAHRRDARYRSGLTGATDVDEVLDRLARKPNP